MLQTQTFGSPVNYSSEAIMASLSRILDSHQTGGLDWPADATHCVVYNTSTWPCGWGKESHVEFFTSRESLDKWITHMRDWARLEDNYFAFKGFEWDLGPQRIEGCSSLEENLPMTFQEKDKAGLIRHF